MACVILTSSGRMTAQTATQAVGVRGAVTDSSSGVLPGVAVTALLGRETLGTTVTDARGEFSFERLPAARVTLQFQLSGFENSTLSVAVPETGQPLRVAHRMEMLAVAETVTVHGEPPLPPPPPRPTLVPVPEHDQMSVCGPARAEAPVPSFGTIRSRRTDDSKVMFGAGDEVLIDGGSATGLAAGQNFIVRRRYPTALRQARNIVVMGEHSSGLVQIVEVGEQWSTGVVVYACDEMMRGDYLAAFEPEPARPADPAGAPAFDDAARILFADAGQPVGVTGRMMVVDRGSRQDMRIGQRLTLFRRSRFGDGRPLVIGDAVVVAVRGHSATILVQRAADAIFFGENGDLAAPHKPLRIAGN
jgi:hypothetical protein